MNSTLISASSATIPLKLKKPRGQTQTRNRTAKAPKTQAVLSGEGALGDTSQAYTTSGASKAAAPVKKHAEIWMVPAPKPPTLGDRVSKWLALSGLMAVFGAAVGCAGNAIPSTFTLMAAAWIASWDLRSRLPVRPWWLLPALCSLAGAIWIAKPLIIQAIRREVFQNTAHVFRVEERGNSAITDDIGKYIEGAERSIEFSGVNFYTSLPQHKHRLIQKLQDGVNIRFLILSPDAPCFAEVAEGFGQTVSQLRGEYDTTVANLEEVKSAAKTARGKLEICGFLVPPRTRLYVFDRELSTGVTIFVPHVYGKDSAVSPAFFASHETGSVAKTYHQSFEKAWNSSKDIGKLPVSP